MVVIYLKVFRHHPLKISAIMKTVLVLFVFVASGSMTIANKNNMSGIDFL